MDYYLKYLKYKNKYIALAQKMYGGDKPSYYNLKNINLFSSESEIENYLNPIYGFIYNEAGIIKNYYNFYDDKNVVSKLVHITFNKISNTYRPTKQLQINVKPRDLGNFLAKKYLYKKYEKLNKINNVIDLIFDMLKGIKNINDFNTKKKYTTEQKTKICENFDNVKHKIKNLMDNNYNEIKIDGLDLNLFLINTNDELRIFLNNYLKRLETYKKQLINDFDVKYKIIYSGNNAEKNINDLIITHGGFYENGQNIEQYHVILSVLWWLADNKEGIKEYYLGLNDILDDELKVIIPVDFSTDMYTSDDLKELPDISDGDLYNKLLALSYFMSRKGIKLFEQQYSKTICSGKNYPDCGETTLRNFINILIYNEKANNFDIEILKKLKSSDNLLEYYTIFNTIELQESLSTLKIFDQELNSRDAWSLIVSNLNDVNYNNSCMTKDDTTYKYEIKVGLSNTTEEETNITNILQVLRYFFRKIRYFDDFEKDEYELNITIEVNLNKDGLGHINFKNSNGEFLWEFSEFHYSITAKISTTELNIDKYRSHLSSREQFYIDLFNMLPFQLYNKYYKDNINHIDNTNNYIYFINYNSDDIINVFNHVSMSDRLYNIIYEYMYNNFDNDKKSRIHILLNKISNVQKYDLSQYRIKYDSSRSKNFNNIIVLPLSLNIQVDSFEKFLNLKILNIGQYKSPLKNSLNNLTNLQSLHLPENYNFPLDNSLNNLNNLENLTFGTFFNQPLNNSLDNLTNLQYLSFGDKFNQPLNNSLNNLTNLKKLVFGIGYNQFLTNEFDKMSSLQNLTYNHSLNYGSLDNFLDKLTNLQNLTFINLSKPLNNLLNNLTNLKSLNFMYNYNMPLNNSLEKLTNLNDLIFGTTFNQPLGNSLHNLTNLNNLMLGDDFNKSLDNSLDTLINLKNLTFGNKFNRPLEKSLDNLINLENLKLGGGIFYSINGSLNNLTNLEKLNLGGFRGSLENFLDNLTRLKTLIFEYNATILTTSFNKLVNLEKIYFPPYFENNILDYIGSLKNLKCIVINEKYEEYSDISLDSLDVLRKSGIEISYYPWT